MKKILGSTITIGVVAAVAVAATGAYFTDTADSTGNTITTGSVTIELDETSGESEFGADLSNLTNLAPGDTVVIPLWVENNGSLPVWFAGYITSEGLDNPAGLLSQFSVKIWQRTGGFYGGDHNYGGEEHVPLATLDLSSLLGRINAFINPEVPFAPLPPGSKAGFVFEITLDEETDSTFENATLTAKMRFQAIQSDNLEFCEAAYMLKGQTPSCE
jgi:predicted ribosomally synthesized peptide with SipW-like signal peptide